MANEMRDTLLLGIRPRLALAVDPISSFQGFLAVSSLGPGTACKVELRLMFEPDGETRTGQHHSFFLARRWRSDLHGARGKPNSSWRTSLAKLWWCDLKGRWRMSRVRFTLRPTKYGSRACGWAAVTRSEQRYVEDSGERVVRELKKIRVALADNSPSQPREAPRRHLDRRHARSSISCSSLVRLCGGRRVLARTTRVGSRSRPRSLPCRRERTCRLKVQGSG